MTRSDIRVTDVDLEAYIDGALDTGRAMVVEDHLAHHPEDAARVMADLRARSALRLIFREERQDTVPVALGNAGHRLAQKLSRRRWRIPAFLGLGGSALAACMALVIAIDNRAPAFVDDALKAHQVALMRLSIGHIDHAPSIDLQQTARHLRVPIPKLLNGWKLADAQLIPSQTGPALHMLVRNTAGQILSIYALHTGKNGPSDPVARTSDNGAVAFWHKEGVGYALAGPGTATELDRAADDLADNRYY